MNEPNRQITKLLEELGTDSLARLVIRALVQAGKTEGFNPCGLLRGMGNDLIKGANRIEVRAPVES